MMVVQDSMQIINCQYPHSIMIHHEIADLPLLVNIADEFQNLLLEEEEEWILFILVLTA